MDALEFLQDNYGELIDGGLATVSVVLGYYVRKLKKALGKSEFDLGVAEERLSSLKNRADAEYTKVTQKLNDHIRSSLH